MFNSDKYNIHYVLSVVRQEEVFEKFLGLEVRFDRNFTNPLRQDKDAGCSFFYRSDGRLIFNDFAWRKFDIFDVVQEKFKVSLPQAIDIILGECEINDQNSSFTGKKTKPQVTIRVRRKSFTKKELKFWNQSNLPIKEEDLVNFDIHSIDTYWLNEKVFVNQDMSFAYHFGNYKYQLYLPNRPVKFLNSSGLIIPNLEIVDIAKEPIVLTKSYKDCFFLSRFGIDAIYSISEKNKIPQSIIDYLLQFNVVCLFDNDKTGIERTEEFQKLGFKTVLFEEWEGKDFTEVLNKQGSSYINDWINEILIKI